MAASEKFTEAALVKLPARERRYVVFDPTLPAFGLRIEPSGVRTFQLSFRVGGRQRMATLGRLGVVTLDKARREARRMLGVVAERRDPLAEHDAARRSMTVREAAAQWMREHVAARRKPATVRQYQHALDGYVLPALAAVPVRQLDTPDVVKLHANLSATPYQANRVVAALSALCSWCERRDLRPKRSNPCLGIERYPEAGHRRYLTTEEYARLGQALRDAARDETVAPGALMAIRLMLLTGCRPAEILTLQWSFVDLKGAALHLPDSKTGRKTVYLPREAVTLLRSWHRFASSYVFPGQRRKRAQSPNGATPGTDRHVFPGTGNKVRGEHLVNVNKPWRMLRAAAGLEDVRLYDACRHSFASVGISAHGQSLSVVGGLLGHEQAATTERYAHLHAETAKEAAGRIGRTIAGAMRRKPAR